MQLRRYRTATVQEALAQARHELGPDALVLSTRLVRARGLRGWTGRREVEVTVAVEREMSGIRPARQPFRQSAPPDPDDPLVAKLTAAGLDAAFARAVAAAVPSRARRGASLATLRAALASQLDGLVVANEPAAPVEVFVGPPGAGKTTTVAKIAAQERARGRRRLSLVAADGFRVGAIEQLRLFADILGTPFVAARSAAEVDRALEAASAPVLVDTAGRSPDDTASRELFRRLAGRPGVRTHLVLPAWMTGRDASRVLDRFEDARPDRIVLTRLDEIESLSPLIGTLRERRIAVSYLGTGQRVPEDLLRATPPRLAACVLGESVSTLGAIA